MPTHRTSNHGSLRYRPRIFWLASWLLVVFYLVASGRAFIPGICATQRALEAQQSRDSREPVVRPIRACCVLPPAGDEDSSEPIAPGDSGCALCKLVSSVAPLAARVEAPAPQVHEFSSPRPTAAQCAADLSGQTLETRAPPFQAPLA